MYADTVGSTHMLRQHGDRGVAALAAVWAPVGNSFFRGLLGPLTLCLNAGDSAMFIMPTRIGSPRDPLYGDDNVRQRARVVAEQYRYWVEGILAKTLGEDILGTFLMRTIITKGIAFLAWTDVLGLTIRGLPLHVAEERQRNVPPDGLGFVGPDGLQLLPPLSPPAFYPGASL